MEEAPEWAAPHAVAARWLSSEGKIDQALLEIRHAEQRRAGSAYQVTCELLARSPRMDYVLRAAPAQDQRTAFLNRTVSTCGRLPADLRAEIDDAILKADPTHAAAALRAARRLATQGRLNDAVDLLQRSLENNEDNVTLYMALIQSHLQGGNAKEAQSVLKEAQSRGLDSGALNEAKAHIEAALGETDAMRATLTLLRGQSRGNAALIARSFMLEGELEASLGNIDEALAAYEAADVASPESPALQYAAALALKSERPTHARRLYRTLCRRRPDGPACAQEARLAKEPGPAPPGRPMP
ncbi:MAG: tetratricopeptide repeat protein [Deltaproteobacteria bacterium]|nr:tetratricopeptide repeat protein [Deltaproteobacteria bacterium]